MAINGFDIKEKKKERNKSGQMGDKQLKCEQIRMKEVLSKKVFNTEQGQGRLMQINTKYKSLKRTVCKQLANFDVYASAEPNSLEHFES